MASRAGQRVGVRLYENGESVFRSPTYRSWVSMRQRCTDPKATSYHRYGGRGITVCERWNSFSNFLADMGARPDGKTLDRINGDGNYEPGNCQWADTETQNRNRSHLRYLDAFGERKLLIDWFQDHRCKASAAVLRSRIYNLGWEPEAAISTPSRARTRREQRQ